MKILIIFRITHKLSCQKIIFLKEVSHIILIHTLKKKVSSKLQPTNISFDSKKITELLIKKKLHDTIVKKTICVK